MMVVTFEQGWPFVEQSIIKLMNMLEVSLEPDFNSEDYMMAYTSIYHMSTQQPPYDYSKQLYNKYQETCELYISSVVLPSLREKHDEFMLRELVKRWTIHKAMVRWLSRFFHYLDRYYIARRSLPSLSEVGLTSFRDRVYKDIHGEVRDVVISLIDREREGQQIDRGLLKNVVNIFVEIGFGKMDCYENDFEAAMLKDTTAYYYWKASNWILEDAFHDFVVKIYQIVQQEKDRVAHYLHSSSEQKLVENVQREFGVYATRLLEKEHSGSHASPMEEKVDDISRMNTLFSSISLGPDPVSNNT